MYRPILLTTIVFLFTFLSPIFAIDFPYQSTADIMLAQEIIPGVTVRADHATDEIVVLYWRPGLYAARCGETEYTLSRIVPPWRGRSELSNAYLAEDEEGMFAVYLLAGEAQLARETAVGWQVQTLPLSAACETMVAADYHPDGYLGLICLDEGGELAWHWQDGNVWQVESLTWYNSIDFASLTPQSLAIGPDGEPRIAAYRRNDKMIQLAGPDAEAGWALEDVGVRLQAEPRVVRNSVNEYFIVSPDNQGFVLFAREAKGWAATEYLPNLPSGLQELHSAMINESDTPNALIVVDYFGTEYYNYSISTFDPGWRIFLQLRENLWPEPVFHAAGAANADQVALVIGSTNPSASTLTVGLHTGTWSNRIESENIWNGPMGLTAYRTPTGLLPYIANGSWFGNSSWQKISRKETGAWRIFASQEHNIPPDVRPAIAADDEGLHALHNADEEYKAVISHYTPTGERTDELTGLSSAYEASVIAHQGLVMAWSTGWGDFAGPLYFARRPLGGPLGAVTKLVDDNKAFALTVCRDDNLARLVYRVNNTIYLAVENDFEHPEVVNSDYANLHDLGVACSSDNIVHVTFTADSDLIYTVKNGATWTTETVGISGGNHNIVAGPGGRVYIAFQKSGVSTLLEKNVTDWNAMH